MFRIGVIGSGFGLYGLLPGFSNLAGCQVTAFCGSQTPRVLQTCKDFAVSQLYTDWRELLDKEELDAVAIAVAPVAQSDICLTAIQKKLPIFAEKPLALSVSQASRLSIAAEQSHLTTCVDFIFSEIFAFQQLKQLLAANHFGQLVHIDLKWDFLSYDIQHGLKTWKTDSTQGGGVTSFYFSHSLYYLEWLFGKMTILDASLSYAPASLNGGEVEVNCTVVFKASGATGTLHASCNNREQHRHIISGTGSLGTFVLENTSQTFDDFRLQTTAESGKVTNIVDTTIVRNQLDDRVRLVSKIGQRFIDACQNRTSMRPGFEDGLRVQQHIDTIMKGRMA